MTIHVQNIEAQHTPSGGIPEYKGQRYNRRILENLVRVFVYLNGTPEECLELSMEDKILIKC